MNREKLKTRDEEIKEKMEDDSEFKDLDDEAKTDLLYQKYY